MDSDWITTGIKDTTSNNKVRTSPRSENQEVYSVAL